MGAILHFLLGDRRGGGVAGGLREGFANVRAARQTEAQREHDLAKIAAQEEGAMARARVQAGAQIGSATIRARATKATGASAAADRAAAALATKNYRNLQQDNHKAINFIRLRGEKDNDLYIPRRADEETQDKYLRHLAFFKDMDNKTFTDIFNDERLGRSVRSHMASSYLGLSKLSEKRDDKGRLISSPMPDVHLSEILSDSIDSMYNDEIMKIKQNTFSKARRDPSNAATLLADGKQVMVKIPKVDLPMARLALTNWDNTHVTSKVSATTEGNKFPELLKSAISSGLPEYSERNKHMYEFGANPNIKAILYDTAGDTEIRAAKDFIFNNPNFFDRRTGLNKEALNKAIDFFAPKKSIRPDITHFRKGLEIEGYRDRLDPKAHQDFQKLAVEASDGVPLAKAALGNLNRLTDAVIEGQVGSNYSVPLAKLITLPETISELASFATNYNRKGHIFSSDRIRDTKGGRELRDQMDEAMANVKNTKLNAAIRAESLELILAYQITAILQGGTGGRTISDTDVKYARSLFSRGTDNFVQRRERLQNIRIMLNGYLNRGSFWDRYRGKDPLSKDHYRAIKNFDVFLQQPGIRNEDGSYKSLEDSLKILGSKTRLLGPVEPFGSAKDAIQRLTNLRSVQPDRIGSFTKLEFEDWIDKTKIMTGTDRGKPFKNLALVQYVPNKTGEGTLIVVDRRSLAGSKKNAEQGAKTASTQAFDITNNVSVKIKWSKNEEGAFDIDHGDQVEPADAKPIKNPNPVTNVYEADAPNAEALQIFTDNTFTPIAQNVLRELGKLESSNNEVIMGDLTPKADGEINAGWMQWRGSRLKHFQEFAKGKGRSIGDWKTSVEFLIEELTNGEKYSAEEGVPGRKYDKLLEAMQGGNNPDTGVPYTYEELYEFFSSSYLRPKKPRKSSPPSVLNKDNIKKRVIKGGGVTLEQVGN